MGTLMGRPRAFERGDKIYLTTPLVIARPTEQQVEEFAFSSAVKTKAPNENIGWLSGRYVEAGKPNLNNAMWLSDELAVKALTPMLMPVTVMHDPRTAVGTIADCKLINEPSSRIDTVLAIWRHRFPEAWEEAEANCQSGQLMQSMECFTPWYTCSECAQQYVKLPNGAERASWCEHLRTNSSWRILGDVCFTGTGLIFGSRGGVGAYTEAYLDHFQDEIAEYHERAHVDSTYKPTQRSTSHMALVSIEESELATLRQERNDARAQVDTLQNEKRELTTRVETAEAAKVAAEGERDTAKTELRTAQETAQQAQLKDTRMSKLGSGFMAKLGDTSKTVLNELAAKASDEEWERAVAEREELAGVKRDAQASSTTTTSSNGGGEQPKNGDSGFESTEVASFMRRGLNGGGGEEHASTQQVDGGTAIRSLARQFANKKRPAAAAKS